MAQKQDLPFLPGPRPEYSRSDNRVQTNSDASLLSYLASQQGEVCSPLCYHRFKEAL